MSDYSLFLASGAGIGPLFIYAPAALLWAFACFVLASQQKKKRPENKNFRYFIFAGIFFVLLAAYSIFYLFPKELGRF